MSTSLRIIISLALIVSLAPAAVHTIPVGTTAVDGSGFKPGDTVRIVGGKRPQLRLVNMHGTKAKPITVINYKGRVILHSSDKNYGLSINGCTHLRLTGTGDAKHDYGFDVACLKKGRHSVNVVGRSSDIAIDHVEVSGAGFAGFNVKDEPRQDGSTNRGQFIMRNIELSYNYVHNTGGEGFYVGHTFYNGYKIAGKLYYPHLIENCHIHHNHTRHTAAEGIQVGSVISGLKLTDNIVEDYGHDPFMKWQDNGIQVGMSAGLIARNTIKRGKGNGLIVLAQGQVQIINNLIIEAGGLGMFIDDRPSSPESIATGGAAMGPGFQVLHNSIIKPGMRQDAPHKNAIRLYGTEVTDRNIVVNNLIVSEHAKPLLYLNGTKKHEAGNWTATKLSQARFVNPGKDDYRLDKASPARNHGTVAAAWNVSDDHAGNKRPNGGWDAGCFEWHKGKRRLGIKLAPAPIRRHEFMLNDQHQQIASGDSTLVYFNKLDSRRDYQIIIVGPFMDG